MHAVCQRHVFRRRVKPRKCERTPSSTVCGLHNLDLYSFSGNVCGALNQKVTEIDLRACCGKLRTCCGNLRACCGPCCFKQFPEIPKSIRFLNFQAGSSLVPKSEQLLLGTMNAAGRASSWRNWKPPSGCTIPSDAQRGSPATK